MFLILSKFELHVLNFLGAVHKVRSQSGGRGLQMRTSALFDAKNFGFFEIYDVSVRTRGVEPLRTVCGQGEGLILWTAAYYYCSYEK